MYKELGFILVLCIGGCTREEPAQTNNATPAVSTILAKGSLKNDEEAEAAARRALTGDASAAANLSAYFTGPDWNRERSDYWARIAAENGDPGSLGQAGNSLERADDACAVLRATFFFERAIAGYEKTRPESAAGLRAELSAVRERLESMSLQNCLHSKARPFE